MSPHKKEAYEQALSFRRRGFTYTDIARFCGVSKATVSNWLRNEPFSRSIAVDNQRRAVAANKQRLSLINKARKTERVRQYAEAERMAGVQYQHYRTAPLFMAGVTIYLTHGASAAEPVVRISSTDPTVHMIFITFACTYLGLERSAIRFWLLLSPAHDEVACMKRWCRQTRLSPAQFYKNQVVPSHGSKKALHFGVGNTIIGSTLHKRTLQTWVHLAKKDLTSK